MNENRRKPLSDAQTGRRISLCIACYLILKPVCNRFLLGGSLAPLAIGIAALLFFCAGVRRSGTVFAVILMLGACAYMPEHLRNLGLNRHLIFALEGAADMLCALILAFHGKVRTYFIQSN